MADKQARELRNLVAKVVQTEAFAGRDVAEWEVWKRVNERVEVATMRDMTDDQFYRARNWLNGWLKNLESSRLDPLRNRIVDLARQTDAIDKLLKFTQREFGHTLIKDLDEAQLKRTHKYLARGKTAQPKP